VAVEWVVLPFMVGAHGGLTVGLRGGWLSQLGTFGWETDEDHPRPLHGPAVDLGGEWIAVNVGIGGWKAPAQ
jgi:hypothetical protein